MLYKFKSKTTGDLIMLEANGRRILEIIGKAPDTKGIVLVAQMPGAIDSLQAAVATEKAAHIGASGEYNGQEKDDSLSLAQRVRPFIDMLKRCHRDGSDMVWGV